jgi:hypothetical protein
MMTANDDGPHAPVPLIILFLSLGGMRAIIHNTIPAATSVLVSSREGHIIMTATPTRLYFCFRHDRMLWKQP